MSSSLPLVIAIVDAVDSARERGVELDIDALSEQLFAAHPEAETSKDKIADMFRRQLKALRHVAPHGQRPPLDLIPRKPRA